MVGYSCGSEEVEPTINCSMSGLTIEVVSTTASDCGLPNGALSVSGSGGQGALSFSIDNSTFQSSGEFTGLTSSTYSVVVKDENDCTQSINVQVSSDSDLSGTITIDNDSGCNSSNGVVTVNATGGAPPYSYSLDSEPSQSVSEYSGLSTGSHFVTIEDSNGCTTQVTANIKSGVSYSQTISPILVANCVLQTCHNDDNGADRNWTVYDNVKAKASGIKTRTASGSMPPSSSGQSLTQDEIDLIACWVDDGALNN